MPPSDKRYRNTVQAFYTIYKNEGLGAFYKGLLPSLFGVSHVAVQFGLYEKSKSWAGELRCGAWYPHRPASDTASNGAHLALCSIPLDAY